MDGQISYLEAQETAIVVNFCMSLLQLYSSNNIGKVFSSSGHCTLFLCVISDFGWYELFIVKS